MWRWVGCAVGAAKRLSTQGSCAALLFVHDLHWLLAGLALGLLLEARDGTRSG